MVRTMNRSTIVLTVQTVDEEGADSGLVLGHLSEMFKGGGVKKFS